MNPVLSPPDQQPPAERRGQDIKDPARLAALRATGLLDSPPEEAYDRFTRLASRLLRAPVSLVSLVDSDRQFFKSQVGLPEPWRSLRQTTIEYSFCQFVVRDGAPLRVPDARADERLHTLRSIEELGVSAYLGVPIRTEDGFILGSFCVVESAPRQWTDDDLAALEDLGKSLTAEIILRERTQLLQRLIEERLDAEREREQTVHMLVHDLRVPLSAVHAGLEMIAGVVPPEEQAVREPLELASQGAAQLEQMINGILETQKIKAGQPVPQKRNFSATEFARSIFRQMLPLAEKNAQELTIHYPPGDFQIFADEGLLRRVLLNLLSNAVKYAGSGARISFGIESVGSGGANFYVEDNGPGVPDAFKAVIFEPFERGAAVTPDDSSSLGLGLAFCKLVAEAHGGKISVEDRPGGGCRFLFSIPPVCSAAIPQ